MKPLDFAARSEIPTNKIVSDLDYGFADFSFRNQAGECLHTRLRVIRTWGS